MLLAVGGSYNLRGKRGKQCWRLQMNCTICMPHLHPSVKENPNQKEELNLHQTKFNNKYLQTNLELQMVTNTDELNMQAGDTYSSTIIH